MSEADVGNDTSPGAAGTGGPGSVRGTPTSLTGNRKQILIALGVMAAILILVFGFLLPSIVSYDDIWAAIRDMELWQFAVVIGLWALKWPIEGLVYARCIPGLGVGQGAVAWSASTSFSNIVPGPGDLLVRLSMYRTWGHTVDRSMIGMTVGGIFQNANRLTLPVVGVAWYAADRGDVGGWLVALVVIGLVVLVVGGVFITMVIRSLSFAERVGDTLTRFVGWLAGKFGRTAPDDLGDQLLEARASMIGLVSERWWQVWLGHASVSAAKFLMLLLALRFAGAGADELSAAEVFLAYALVQLITIIPITNGNIGVAEIAYIAILLAFSSGSDAIAGAIAAGVIVFRIVEWLLVIPVGFISTAVWRSRWRSRLGFDPFTILARGDSHPADAVTD